MRYEIKVLRGKEGLSLLALEAADTADAATQARAQGYTVISIKEKRPLPALRLFRSGSFPLVLFSQELLSLLEAGLPLLEAIETLSEREHRPEVKKTMQQIITSLYEGHTLSHAMQQAPTHFPPLFVATVRASEKTGDLPEALSRYIAYQSQMDRVKRQVISASIYPSLLFIVGSLVSLFLMTYVVPRFSHIYADMGGNLPLASRLLMEWGQLMEHNSTLVMGGLISGFVAVIYLVSLPAVRQWVGKKLWQLPTVGERLHLYNLARFYRSLGMLLRGGMPIVTALQMTSGLLQASMRGQLALASTSIREGQPISQAMEKNQLATPVALRMLRVGEHTGRMGDMMERIASFYEDDMARWVERFTKLFEPLLMVFIGGVIGVVVLLMYFPIFELAGSIQ